MRRTLVMLAVGMAFLASCGSDDDGSPSASDGSATELPDDAEKVTTPEGDTVYVSESEAVVLGPCEVIEPHESDLAGWLDMDPPRGLADWGVACTLEDG